jgi:tetratricopeptide (TPR) repeat protein
MQELQIIITRHSNIFQRSRKIYESLPDPELNNNSSLYIEQNKYFEAIEAQLLHSGLSAIDLEAELYRLRLNYNTVEHIFYVRATETDSPRQAGFNDLIAIDRLIWDATELMRINHHREALHLLDMALAFDDKSVLSYANMGVIAHKKRNWGQGVFYFNKALSLDPNNVQVLSYKLDALRGGDLTVFSEFMQVIDKLLELNPYHPVALDYKCQVAFQARDLVAMKTYGSRYFENWYMEKSAIPYLNNLLSLMSVDESILFLDAFSKKLKWDGAKMKLQRIKIKYLRKVKESEEYFEELGAASIITPDSSLSTVSMKLSRFKFEGKV